MLPKYYRDLVGAQFCYKNKNNKYFSFCIYKIITSSDYFTYVNSIFYLFLFLVNKI